MRQRSGRVPQAERGPVLVVDDDPHMRQMISWALEDDGLLVATAADGRQALELAAQRRPALVVLDLTLPDLGGEEISARLRGERTDLPILVITADGYAQQKARRVGAYAYLHKPFELAELLEAVRRGLATR